MSTTAVGPTLDIDGPLPVAPPHSLLQTEGVVVDRDEGRWMNGVNVAGYPTSVPSSWEPCATGTFRVKEEGDDLPQARFDPIALYLPVTCSAIGQRNAETLAEKASEALEAKLSFGVERVLSHGVELSPNPFFGDGELDILAGGAAVSAGVALSYLEEAIGETGAVGVIHATPAVVAALSVIPVGDDASGPLLTANGNLVVSGGGYSGADPLGGVTADLTEDWIFATGPIQVRIGPEVITDLVETLDRSDNSLTFRAERYVVAGWDTALQAGVLVDWTL